MPTGLVPTEAMSKEAMEKKHEAQAWAIAQELWRQDRAALASVASSSVRDEDSQSTPSATVRRHRRFRNDTETK